MMTKHSKEISDNLILIDEFDARRRHLSINDKEELVRLLGRVGKSHLQRYYAEQIEDEDARERVLDLLNLCDELKAIK